MRAGGGGGLGWGGDSPSNITQAGVALFTLRRHRSTRRGCLLTPTPEFSYTVLTTEATKRQVLDTGLHPESNELILAFLLYSM